MATSCAYEFQVRHLAFQSADESNFYEFQYFKNKLAYVIFRAFLCCYHWGWLIAGWVLAAPDHYYTLSNWSVFFTGLYFLSSFLTSLYGIIRRRDYAGSKTDPALSSNAAAIEKGSLKYFHKITWALHSAATVAALYVTVIYWVAVAPGVARTEPWKLRMPIGQHKHSVQLILIVIDFFFTAVPTRWLHFICGQILAFLYCIMVVIVHFAEVDSAVYSFLNFKTNVGLAVGVMLVAFLIAPIIVHSIFFGLYHLRMFIHRQTVSVPVVTPPPKVTSTDVTHDNPAFVP